MDERTLLRFTSKIDRRGPIPETRPDLGPCWVWLGAPSTSGYGYFWFDRKKRLAHRFSYELFVGPIPESLVIDHLCRNRMCLRPTHLEPVSDRVNILRGEAPAARNVLKDTCFMGHPFDEENTFVDKNGDRGCRTCQRRRLKEWAEKNRPKKGSHQTAKTHCPQGHPYDEANTYIPPRGGRNCRACTRTKNREAQQARRAKAKAVAEN
jgi:hypothetical protein